jgi:predicted  nucleic acid-binding Zn-ribbon protein
MAGATVDRRHASVRYGPTSARDGPGAWIAIAQGLARLEVATAMAAPPANGGGGSGGLLGSLSVRSLLATPQATAGAPAPAARVAPSPAGRPAGSSSPAAPAPLPAKSSFSSRLAGALTSAKSAVASSAAAIGETIKERAGAAAVGVGGGAAAGAHRPAAPGPHAGAPKPKAGDEVTAPSLTDLDLRGLPRTQAAITASVAGGAAANAKFAAAVAAARVALVWYRIVDGTQFVTAHVWPGECARYSCADAAPPGGEGDPAATGATPPVTLRPPPTTITYVPYLDDVGSRLQLRAVARGDASNMGISDTSLIAPSADVVAAARAAARRDGSPLAHSGDGEAGAADGQSTAPDAPRRGDSAVLEDADPVRWYSVCVPMSGEGGGVNSEGIMAVAAAHGLGVDVTSSPDASDPAPRVEVNPAGDIARLRVRLAPQYHAPGEAASYWLTTVDAADVHVVLHPFKARQAALVVRQRTSEDGGGDGGAASPTAAFTVVVVSCDSPAVRDGWALAVRTALGHHPQGRDVPPAAASAGAAALHRCDEEDVSGTAPQLAAAGATEDAASHASAVDESVEGAVPATSAPPIVAHPEVHGHADPPAEAAGAVAVDEGIDHAAAAAPSSSAPSHQAPSAEASQAHATGLPTADHLGDHAPPTVGHAGDAGSAGGAPLPIAASSASTSAPVSRGPSPAPHDDHLTAPTPSTDVVDPVPSGAADELGAPCAGPAAARTEPPHDVADASVSATDVSTQPPNPETPIAVVADGAQAALPRAPAPAHHDVSTAAITGAAALPPARAQPDAPAASASATLPAAPAVDVDRIVAAAVGAATARADATVASLQGQVAALTAQVASLTAQLADSQAAAARSQAAVAKAADETKRALATAAATGEELKAAKAKLSKATEEMDAARAALSSSKSDNSDAGKRIEKLQKQAQQAGALLAECKAELEDTRRQLREASDGLDAARTDGVAKTRQLAKLTDTCDELRRVGDAAGKERDRLSATLTDKSAEAARVSTALAVAQERVRQLEAELRLATDTATTLHAERDEARGSLAAAAARIAELSASDASWRDRAEGGSVKLTLLSAEVESLRTRTGDLTRALDVATRDKVAANAAADAARAEAATLQGTVATLDSKVKRLAAGADSSKALQVRAAWGGAGGGGGGGGGGAFGRAGRQGAAGWGLGLLAEAAQLRPAGGPVCELSAVVFRVTRAGRRRERCRFPAASCPCATSLLRP